jgi:hypothetical protein
MKKDLIRIFLKTVAWIAPINAFIAVSALYTHSGWLNEILDWVAGILNFPTIWFISNYATAFLKSPNVNWYVATPILSFFCSFLWALVIAFIKVTVEKKRSTEHRPSADPRASRPSVS